MTDQERRWMAGHIEAEKSILEGRVEELEFLDYIDGDSNTEHWREAEPHLIKTFVEFREPHDPYINNDLILRIKPKAPEPRPLTPKEFCQRCCTLLFIRPKDTPTVRFTVAEINFEADLGSAVRVQGKNISKWYTLDDLFREFEGSSDGWNWHDFSTTD